MKTCPQCERELPDDAIFCMYCGTVQDSALDRQPSSQVTGSDAVAQDHSVATGEGGVAVGRDVHGNVNIYLAEAAKTAPFRDVPMLEFCRQIEPKQGFPHPGMRLTDRPEEDRENPPVLYVDVFLKKSRLFGKYPIDENEKWVYVEANTRPAINLRTQVHPWNPQDEEEFIRVLRGDRESWALRSPRPEANEQHAGDYLYVWQEGGEYRMMLSAFTATNAGISVHARLLRKVAYALAQYLVQFGFSTDAQGQNAH